MKLQEIVVPDVIEVSPDETIGAAAPSQPALATGPCLNVQGSTFKACPEHSRGVQGVERGR
jgi:hypothetical protein